jgi:two-component system cell cycle sensor histidine kinase PleC
LTDGKAAPDSAGMLQLINAVSGIRGRFRAIPLSRRIILLTLVLLAAVYAGNVLILTHYYGVLAERERDSRDAKAQLLAEHAGRALAAVDLSLETIADTLKAHLPLGKPTIFTQILLDKYIKNLPQARALLVVDADGVVVNNSRAFPPASMIATDRSFFSEQKKWRGVGLYLDRIEISRVDGKPFFAVSQPILDNDGNFCGVVAAITDPQYFASFYDPHGEPANDIALLQRDDGAVLASAGILGEAPSGESDRARASMREVNGFAAKIVLIGKPISTLPQFSDFVATDLGLLAVMTLMALSLATKAAREAAAVNREASARRTAEARLLNAIESAPAGFALYDRDDRLVLSNGLYRSFHDPIGDLIKPGAAFPQLVEAAIERRVYADDAVARGDQEFLEWRVEQHRTGVGEQVLQLRDGRWFLTRERRTNEGDTVSFYSDITPLKEREAQLQRLNQAQNLFVAALEHIPSSLMLCDPEDRLVFCNSPTRRYFPNIAHLLVPGTPFESLVRGQVDTGYLPSSAADPEQWIKERMAQHLAGNTNAVRAYADGRWAQIVERRTESGYSIGIRTEITEIKQAEEALRLSEMAERAARRAAEQANQAKTAFLASMSHELRTPLNAIIGFSEMIERKMLGPLPETYRNYGEIVRASGQHLLSIINDILDVAKLNSGKAELYLQTVDVGRIISEAVSIISKKADSAGVEIVTEIDARCPPIDADPVRLRQVMLNLLTNAVKFTPAGGRVEVATARAEHELRICVSDTGIGMAPEDIPRALEPFTQINPGKPGAQEGTGLGLPISKTLVALHGGRFDITSAPARGTTVTIALPFRHKDEAGVSPVLDIAV